MKQALFIGAIASILATGAYATSTTVTSKDYVDTQDATKQNLIPVKSLVISDGGKVNFIAPHTLVESPTTTPGEIGERGILDNDLLALSNLGSSDASMSEAFNDSDGLYGNLIPTARSVSRAINFRLESKQQKIPKSGYRAVDGNISSAYNTDPANNSNWNSWLSPDVKGTGLVTRTSTDDIVGERKIFEASDISGYHDTNLTQSEKDIQDISIPIVGAMMTAISNGVNAATPTGNPNTIANFDSNGAFGSGIATYTGATAYNATNDSAKIPTMAGITNYAQAKKVCVGWPDGTTVADATHTDENCWLWNLPD